MDHPAFSSGPSRLHIAGLPSGKPRDHTRAHIVHRGQNRKLVVVDQTREHLAAGDQLFRSVLRVALADLLDEFLVLGVAAAVGRRTMARAALDYARRQLAGWREVLEEDLFSLWREAAPAQAAAKLIA